MKKGTVVGHEQEVQIKQIKPPAKKLFFGFIIFLLSILAPLFIPIIIQLNLSATFKAIISGLLVFGLPEIGMLLAVAILGKEGFLYLKSQLFFCLKQNVISTTVSRTRYRIGIVLFSIILIIDFLMPYINYFASIQIQREQYYLILLLDISLFISLIILGGNFWDKLKALFIYDMTATKCHQ